MSKSVFSEINHLSTEGRNPATENIDLASSEEIVRLINIEDQKCALEVQKHSAKIANAIDLITEKLRDGGRLFYIGAGTSGRLGVLDASECPPTFGTDPDLVQGVIAGGYDTLIRSKEGIEDQKEQGWLDLLERKLTEKDIVVAIMASGRTPYVIGAIAEAKKHNISTIILSCNDEKTLATKADINICLNAGPEAISGSTRMKAGTMQKMVLNMLSTGTMIRLGKVYKNIMVDVQMTSKKLEERAKRMVMDLCGLSYTDAESLLKSANGHVKSAIAMHFTKMDLNTTSEQLEKNNGFLRKLI